MNYMVPYEASDYIMQVANNAIQNIVMGVALSALVVLLFLRRAGLLLPSRSPCHFAC